jgi:hypothetical protein
MERVIFDTNAYRYLVKDKDFENIDRLIEKIKSKEAQRGIQSMISPIVARELLAHVADRSDPAFEKCLKAIKAMYLHSEVDGAYHILASPELLVAKSFFNETIPRKIETNEALIQIAYHLAKDPSDHVFTKFQRNLNQNREQVLETESFFAQSLWQMVKGVDPSSSGWRIFANDPVQRQKLLAEIRSENTSLSLAAALIATVYKLLKDSGSKAIISYDQLYGMSREFIKVFPEYIDLYKYVFESLVNSEFNLLEDSRTNFIWDIQLMLNVGDHTLGGEKLYFVTDDKALTRAAIRQNARYTILTFDEYLDYVN